MNAPNASLKGLDLRAEIDRLRKERNAIILAHYYQEPALQDIADFVGDSLDLSRKAEATDADVIAFCGVRFMAETAKILSPQKIVVLPDMNAGCSLEDSCPPDQFKAFREAHPDHIALTYINCSAAVKALSDIIVTSSSADIILKQIPLDQKIIFGPDRHLGGYLARKTGRDMLLWPGVCIVHQAFSETELLKLKAEHPGAPVAAHPECPPHIIDHADHVGSTGRSRVRDDSPAHDHLSKRAAHQPPMKSKAAPARRSSACPGRRHCNCTCARTWRSTGRKCSQLRDLSRGSAVGGGHGKARVGARADARNARTSAKARGAANRPRISAIVRLMAKHALDACALVWRRAVRACRRFCSGTVADAGALNSPSIDFARSRRKTRLRRAPDQPLLLRSTRAKRLQRGRLTAIKRHRAKDGAPVELGAVDNHVSRDTDWAAWVNTGRRVERGAQTGQVVESAMLRRIDGDGNSILTRPRAGLMARRPG